MPARSQSVLIVEARFYEDISDELLRGAVAELERNGVGYRSITVPGALEIPIALAMAVEAGQLGPKAGHQGCVALGCVIRGETGHYDIVANESACGLMQIGLRHAIPVGNGILTVDTAEQAWARARVGEGDKGGMAAAACLALMGLPRRLKDKR